MATQTRRTSQAPSTAARSRAAAPRHPASALRSQMDQLFDSFFEDWGMPRWGLSAPSQRLFPSIDMSEDDKNIVVVADLPGVEEKDIDLSLNAGVLTVKAERKSETEKGEAGKTLHHVERSFGVAHRSIRLPCEVDEEKVTATFAQGVLTVTLPKAAPAKPKAKRIEVKSA